MIFGTYVSEPFIGGKQALNGLTIKISAKMHKVTDWPREDQWQSVHYKLV